jgi:plastocyanin
VRIEDKDGKARPTLNDCVAILEPITSPARSQGASRPLMIRTANKQFEPRVALATPGTEVSFPNMDAILHNVFSVTPGNRFDTGHYLPGDAPRVKLNGPGLVKLYCNVHHQMNAFIWVVDTPFAQLLNHRQDLRFDGIPAGTYRLRLWHPEAGEKTWTIEVGGEVTRGSWTLKAALPALEPHKNKFGKDYPPAPDEAAY